MSKIRITKKDFAKIVEWRDNGRVSEMRRNCYYAFPKGEIEIIEPNGKIINKIEFNLARERVFEFVLYMTVGKSLKKAVSFEFHLTESWGALGQAYEMQYGDFIDTPALRHMAIQDTVTIFFGINYYAVANKTAKVVKPLSQRASKSEPIRKIGKNKYVVSPAKLTRVVSSEGKVVDANGVKRGFYQFHKEEWEVRGFLRTYKSGKQVWIKPSKRKRQLESKELKYSFNDDDTVYTF